MGRGQTFLEEELAAIEAEWARGKPLRPGTSEVQRKDGVASGRSEDGSGPVRISSERPPTPSQPRRQGG